MKVEYVPKSDYKEVLIKATIDKDLDLSDGESIRSKLSKKDMIEYNKKRKEDRIYSKH